MSDKREKMTSTTSKAPFSRQRMTEDLVQQIHRYPQLHKIPDPRPGLKQQFRFPQPVWDKLKAMKNE